MTTFIVLLIAGQLLTLALVLLSLHKVRRMHLATFKIAADARVARTEAGALFSQMQALGALERTLKLPGPLPPVRGWAGSPDFLLYVAQHVLSRKPLSVVECSSGVSTVVAARCLELNGAGHVFSLEHDPVYAAKTTALLEQFGLQAWATVLVAPLEVGEEGIPWYREGSLPPELESIDLLVVDGPPGRDAKLARYPALPRLKQRLAATATILLDDANRPDEREIVSRWLAESSHLTAEFVPCEKGLALLTSP